MKTKMMKVIGVLLTASLVLSMFAVAAPVSAAPGENAWDEIGMPDLKPGTDVGVMAIDADGSILAAIDDNGDWIVMKSTDDGYTWSEYFDVPTPDIAEDSTSDTVVDIEISVDGTVYIALINGDVWRVADGEATLLKEIVDSNGDTLDYTGSGDMLYEIDVWNDGSSNWVLVACDLDVLVLKDALFEDWRDQEMATGGDWACAVYAEFAPDFASSEVIWALWDSNDDGNMELTSTISPGQWGMALEPVEFVNQASATMVSAYYTDIEFADNYNSETNPLLYVALVGESNDGNLWMVQADEAGGTSEADPLLPDDMDCGTVEVSGSNILVMTFWGTLYSSNNAGDTFTEAAKGPTGMWWPHVYMAPGYDEDDGVVYVSAFGPGSAFSISEDGGQTFNGISYLDLDIAAIVDVAFDGDSAYMVTQSSAGLGFYSMWRTDDATATNPVWEWVWSEFFHVGPPFAMLDIEVALDSSSIFMFVSNDGDYEVWKSTDNAQTWSHWRDLPSGMTSINDWVIESSTTMYAATNAGFWGTSAFGPATIETTGALASIDVYGDTIAVGGADSGALDGNVLISTDAGETWGDEINVATGDIYVAFGPDGTLYAASSASNVYVIDPDATTVVTTLKDSDDSTATADEFTGIWVSPDNVVYAMGAMNVVPGGTTYGEPTCGGTIEVEAESYVSDPEATGSFDFDIDTVTVRVTDDDVEASYDLTGETVTLSTLSFYDGENVSYSGDLTYTSGTNTMAGTVTVTGDSSSATGTVSVSFNPTSGNFTNGTYSVSSYGPNTVTVVTSTDPSTITVEDNSATNNLSLDSYVISVTSGNFTDGENATVIDDGTGLLYTSGPPNTLTGTLTIQGLSSSAEGTVAVTINAPAGTYTSGNYYAVTGTVSMTIDASDIATTGDVYVIDDVTTDDLTLTDVDVVDIAGTFVDAASITLIGDLTYVPGTNTFDGTLTVDGGTPPNGTTANVSIDASTFSYYTAGDYSVTDLASTTVTVNAASDTETISLSGADVSVTSGYFTSGETVALSGSVTVSDGNNNVAGTLTVTGATGAGTVYFPSEPLDTENVNNNTYTASGTATIGGALATNVLTVPSGTNMDNISGSFSSGTTLLDVDASILVASSSTILEGVIYVSEGGNTAEVPVTLFDTGLVMGQPYTIIDDHLEVTVDAETGDDTDAEAYLYRLLIGEEDNIWETAQNDGASGLWGTQGSNILWTIVDGDTLWALEDTVSGPVTLVSPADGAKVAGKTSATLTWEELAEDAEYEVGGDITATGIDELEYAATGLTDNTEYTWKVRVEAGAPFQSRWSEEWTFTTTDDVEAPVAAPDLMPINGAYNVPVKGPAFAWTFAGEQPDAYTWQLSTDPLFGTIMAEADLTTSYYVYADSLEYNTAYYWRVRAYSDAGGVSEWVTSIFTTASAPADPVVVEEQQPPTITIERPAKDMPGYVWAVIAVGLALITSIIVLIIRTRRV